MATDRREHRQKLFERKTVIKVVEQRLRGNAGTPEDKGAAHEFGIRMDRAVVGREHECQRRGPIRSVNRLLPDCEALEENLH